MGGDGGSLPARSVMVKTKGYGLSRNDSIGGMGYGANHMGRIEEEIIDNKRLKQIKMQYCTLTQDILYKKPVVVCRYGNMYSKESLYKALLDKTKQELPKELKHIRKIKDVRTANIEWIDNIDITKDRHCTFRCPITKKDLDDGSRKVVMLWSCGCIMDKECCNINNNKCMNCGAPYNYNNDIINIAPMTEDEIKHNKDIYNRLNNAKRTTHKKKNNKGYNNINKQDTLTATINKRTFSARKEYIDDAMNKLRKSSVYDSLFNNKNNDDDRDAFGRSF